MVRDEVGQSSDYANTAYDKVATGRREDTGTYGLRIDLIRTPPCRGGISHFPECSNLRDGRVTEYPIPMCFVRENRRTTGHTAW
jgi:hypothetical protein